ncbi:MAG TPA: iron-containing redox enzyme family protein [Chloroflexota bacterium]|nr:iron-containing redox enzyme family protein [Chloroflexota bacterium]
MVLSTAADVIAELNRMTNAQFASPEFQHLLSLPITLPRARLYVLHRARYQRHRRDVWAYVQAAAPLDVKHMIWEHEREELDFDPRAGSNHIALGNRECEVVGLTPEEVDTAELVPGVVACFWAWVHLAMTRPWLEAFTASSVMERRNSGDIVQGGGLSMRMAQNIARGLGIPVEQLKNSTVHSEADVEHGAMLDIVAERYATTEEARQAMLRGARDSLLIDRAFRAALAEAMEDLP